MSFANLPIARKVLCLVALLLAMTMLVAGIGINGLRSMDQAHRTLEAADGAVINGLQVSRDLAVLNRAEYRLVTNPTAEMLSAAERTLAEARPRAEAAMVELGRTEDPERRRLLRPIEEGWRRFVTEFEDTLATARRLGDNARTEEGRAELLASADQSRQATEPLSAAIAAVNAHVNAVAKVAAATAQAASDRSTTIIIAVSAFALMLGGMLAWLTGQRGIALPIRESVTRLRALADGDTDSPVPGAERKDELGDIARTMAVFRENLIAAREAKERELREAEAKAERARRIDALTRSFEEQAGTVVKSVATAATEMEATATGMAAGAEETLRQASAVAAAAGQASANVQTVAAAAEELAASVSEISRQVAESTRIAEEAVSEAERTGSAVHALSENAQKISDVVRLISEIAGQTNLLALNATIEAARAGEAGKGFAVVASEVKNLAAQTGKATEEIAGQVSAVQAETTRVVEAIRGMGEVISRLSQIATSIAAAVEEQGAATGEIARNVQQASAGTSSVSTSIGSVNDAAATSGAAAAQVQAAARDLSQGAETLRAQVEAFLTQMKAA